MASTTKTAAAAKPAASKSPAHDSLESALAAFQAEVPSIRKGNEATVVSQKGSYKYAYADLADVTERVLPLLGKHGLMFTAIATLGTTNGFVLMYELRHTSGGRFGGMYPLPDPRQTPPQQLGAAITYARRYTLCAATGVAPGGDDDDAHSVPAAAPYRPAQPEPEVTRDWVGEAEAASDRDAVGALWQELRVEVNAGRAPSALLDKVAAVGRARAAAETDGPAEAEAAPVEVGSDDV